MKSETRPSSTAARRCGAIARGGGSVEWRVWAPRAREVSLVLIEGQERRRLPMEAQGHGFFQRTEPGVRAGQRYFFVLDDGPELPDPASLWQPDGVDGPSAVVLTNSFTWSDSEWPGLRHEELVFHEIHTGTFTPEGTFEAIGPRLSALRQLGVTAIELMPVGQFPGRRNWGYGGVFPYAAQNSYGGPQGLQRLVDLCHSAGLAVFLDVVYNHVGPEGCCLQRYGPYFTSRHKTPWGDALNFDGPGSDAVREFVVDNARMWLEEFHCDGLRIDAVHAIFDLSARHILAEVRQAAAEVEARTGRRVHIIAESDLNDSRVLDSPDRGGYGLDTQWADDFHHAVHAFLTGERRGYYGDFGDARSIAAAYRSPFVYAGDYSRHRDRKHGAAPSPGLTGDRFIVCLQNHDQVGNRPRGDRLVTLLADPAKLGLAASLLLLSPYLPLLFMGEEYGEGRPFPYFCSFRDAELVRAVREGRQRDCAAFGPTEDVPDPQSERAFAAARLRWSWDEGTRQASLRRLYSDLLAVRRSWPALRDRGDREVRIVPDDGAGEVLEVIRNSCPGEALQAAVVCFNLSGAAQHLPLRPDDHPRRLLFSSEWARYGGNRSASDPASRLLAHECVAFGPSSWRSFE